MNCAGTDARRRRFAVTSLGMVYLVALAGLVSVSAWAQQTGQGDAATAQQQTTTPAPNPDSRLVGDTPLPGMTAADNATVEGREHAAWKLLTDAMEDAKHPQTRIQALAALGLLRSAKSEQMIASAMLDSDLDVRTAAILAAGQAKDRNLTTNIRNLLDDKEPQVAFTAAMTLWKMGDKSGEDILMAVVDGQRSANASMMHGTEHRITKDLHDPAMLARLGALQGAAMVLGPFGFGITAFEYIRQNGGDLSRVSAIEQLSQERTDPVHRELIAALADKDQAVRAAAARTLVDYRDRATAEAVYALLIDPKQPVRLTAAAAYLRTRGTPGPERESPATTPARRKRLTVPSSTRPTVTLH